MIIIVGGLLCSMLLLFGDCVDNMMTIMNGVSEIRVNYGRKSLRFDFRTPNYWHPEPRVLTTAFVGGYK